MNKIEHIGIATADIHKANEVFEILLGSPSYKTEDVASEGVSTHFFRLGPNKIELLSSNSENNAIKKFLEKKGPGIHHIAISVDNILFEMERLQDKGFEFVYAQPKRGADNQLINFVHPKCAEGVLIELCQKLS